MDFTGVTRSDRHRRHRALEGSVHRRHIHTARVEYDRVGTLGRVRHAGAAGEVSPVSGRGPIAGGRGHPVTNTGVLTREHPIRVVARVPRVIAVDGLTRRSAGVADRHVVHAVGRRVVQVPHRVRRIARAQDDTVTGRSR
ncbi:MAG: hypothetical protein KCHDKBKB_02026 [Elusimicrobia bacterium]|nr:hypothetical protein [Elusimicrobiota bacterium]